MVWGIAGNQHTGLASGPLDQTAPPPASLNWDLWPWPSSGAVIMCRTIYAPFKWRDWFDFGGGGTVGDFGCHVLDPVFTALGTNRSAHDPRRETGRA
jgi:hypothetical protein